MVHHWPKKFLRACGAIILCINLAQDVYISNGTHTNHCWANLAHTSKCIKTSVPLPSWVAIEHHDLINYIIIMSTTKTNKGCDYPYLMHPKKWTKLKQWLWMKINVPVHKNVPHILMNTQGINIYYTIIINMHSMCSNTLIMSMTNLHS